MEGKLLLGKEVYSIVGCALRVHNELGVGFLEAVYQEAMELELKEAGIPFESQKMLDISYRSRILRKKYVADLVCYGSVVVELKAIERLSSVDQAQLLNYLRVTGKRVGLLVNFGRSARLEWRRFVL